MKKTRRPRIVILFILTTLTILTWVAFEVWRSFTKPQPVQIDSKILKPLDPGLDTQTLDKLKGSLYLPDSDARRGAPNATAAASASPSATASASPKASVSPTSTPAPTSAPSGGSQ